MELRANKPLTAVFTFLCQDFTLSTEDHVFCQIPKDLVASSNVGRAPRISILALLLLVY